MYKSTEIIVGRTMRVQNSIRNMLFGLSGQLISCIMGFIVRTVFISTLGIEYLGVDGLFSNILTLLSLTNLGFDTAIIYSLYKPLAENNQTQIMGLMNLYKKAYRLIGVTVLSIGLLLLPFLPYMINGETTIDSINTIYILFLINSAASYFFVYKQAIIIADQQNHVISKVYSIFAIISNLFQVILLVCFKNYLIVLTTQIALRILQNLYISIKTNRLYPYLKGKNNVTLSEADKRNFFQNIYSLMLYRISGVVINGTDNLVISKFVGLVWVGICANYLLITSTLNTFLGHIFYSITASVGNLNVNESSEKKYLVFRILNFSNFWVYGFCSVCLWNLINPFIILWLGERFVMNKLVVFAIVLNFYTAGMQNAATTFRETTGLFRRGKYIPILAAIINIIVSIILAKTIGIAGVFLGTVFSRLCTYFWYDPYASYKLIFQQPVRKYFIRYFCFGLIVSVSSWIPDIAGSFIYHNPLLNITIRGILCLIVPNIIILAVYRGSEELNYLLNIMKQYIKKTSFRSEKKKSFNMEGT